MSTSSCASWCADQPPAEVDDLFAEYGDPEQDVELEPYLMEAGEALRFASFSDVMTAYSDPRHLKHGVIRDYIKMLKDRDGDGTPHHIILSDSSSLGAPFDFGTPSESPSAYFDDAYDSFEGGIVFCDMRDNQVPNVLCFVFKIFLFFLSCNVNHSIVVLW
jgi:hypothetical protein